MHTIVFNDAMAVYKKFKINKVMIKGTKVLLKYCSSDAIEKNLTDDIQDYIDAQKKTVEETKVDVESP